MTRPFVFMCCIPYHWLGVIVMVIVSPFDVEAPTGDATNPRQVATHGEQTDKE